MMNSAINNSFAQIEGYGGGLYFTCSSADYLCKVLMNGKNEFKKNNAENAGGGIKWDDIEPVF